MDVFDLTIDGLDSRPLAEEEFVCQFRQSVAQLSKEVHPILDQEMLYRDWEKQLSLQIAGFKPLDLIGNGPPIIDIIQFLGKRVW